MFNLDFSKINYDSVAREFEEGVTLDIRPYPMSEEEIPVSNTSVPLKNQKKKWLYVVSGWNLKDAAGKNLPCNNEIKSKMFDFSQKLQTNKLIIWALNEADKLRDEQEESIKN